MKIAVIGAGAMGSIYASFLSKNNNKVLVIDKGQIIQHGTNSELKEIDGYYKYLFERQKLEKL